MNLININTVVVIGFSKNEFLYPTHEVVLSEDYLPLEGLLQSCEEFILAVPNSSLTLKKKPSSVELFVENFENPSTLTINYFDVSEFSLPAKTEILADIPTAWRPSKEALECFPQILGEAELGKDLSQVPGFTEVNMERDEKIWVPISEPLTLTELLKNILVTLKENQQLIFKIPTYPLIEIQDTEKVSYRQLWLVREK